MSSYSNGSGLKGAKKSPNFDRNKNGDLMSQIAKKNMYKIASIINTTAKQKFIPIATRETYNSAKIRNIGIGSVELSSINHGGTRYDYTGSNKGYSTGRGYIPAGKNAGKNHWYQRSATLKKSILEKVSTEGIIKK